MIGPERERCRHCGAVVDWGQPERAIWQREDMRAALAVRDVRQMYKILQKYGFSQRRIAGLTTQSQSEVAEIMGGRRVVSYDVLVRIAEGLGVPRGLMGLAYADGESDNGGQPSSSA